MSYLLIGVGGYLGSILRYWISLYFHKERSSFPFSTFLVNIAGSSLLAIIYSVYQAEWISILVWELVGIGFCGAFTTFSTFNVELLHMIQNKQWHMAVIYAFVSVTVSFLTFYFIIKLFI